MLSVEEQRKINEIVTLFRHSRSTSCIILVDCINQVLRAEIEEEIRRRLREEGFVFKKVKMTSNGNKNLTFILKQSKPRANKIFFIYDFKKTLPKDFLETREWPESLQHLNYNREDFADQNISALFWLDKPTLQAVAKRAPDFWAFRNLVVEFVETRERISQLMRDKAIHPSYRYADKKEIAKKIKITRSMLDDFLRNRPKEYDAIRPLYNQLFTFYFLLGDYKRSLLFAKKSMRYALKSDDKEVLAGAIGNLGLSCASLGDLDQALAHYRKALANFKKIGSLDGEAWILNLLGNLYLQRGNLHLALKCSRNSLKICKKTGNPVDTAEAFISIGYVLYKQGEFDKALDYFKQSLEISEDHRYQKGIVEALRFIAYVYEDNEELQIAKKYYKMAVKKAEKIGYLDQVSWSMRGLGSLFEKRGDFDKALNYYSDALKITKKIGTPLDLARDLRIIASVYVHKGLYNRALTYFQKSLALSRKVGAKDEIEAAKGAIKTIKKRTRKIEKS